MEHFWEVKDLSVSYENLDGLTQAVDHVSYYVAVSYTHLTLPTN